MSKYFYCLKEVCKTLEEAHKILSWEPEGTEESRLAKTARKELDDCKSFLSALELEIALSMKGEIKSK